MKIHAVVSNPATGGSDAAVWASMWSFIENYCENGLVPSVGL